MTWRNLENMMLNRRRHIAGLCLHKLSRMGKCTETAKAVAGQGCREQEAEGTGDEK